AGRRVHGLEHVVEQGLEAGGGHLRRIDRRGRGTQARIGEFEDGQQGHGADSWGGRDNPPAVAILPRMLAQWPGFWTIVAEPVGESGGTQPCSCAFGRSWPSPC